MDVAREAASEIRCLDHGEIVRVIDRPVSHSRILARPLLVAPLTSVA